MMTEKLRNSSLSYLQPNQLEKNNQSETKCHHLYTSLPMKNVTKFCSEFGQTAPHSQTIFDLLHFR